MTEPKSFDELINAWKRLSDEYLAGFRQAFEAGASAFTASGTARSEAPGATSEEQMKGQRGSAEPGREEASQDMSARLDALEARVRRIEEALSAIADGDFEDDWDDDFEERLDELEARVEALRRRARRRQG